MVLKLLNLVICVAVSFESDVISDGTQTHLQPFRIPTVFESDVISDGTQTMMLPKLPVLMFESDVISDGTQTSTYLYPQWW